MSDDLEIRLDLMGRNHDFSDGLVERFGQWVRTADDADLFRVGVVGWAAAHGVDEDEALDLFLHATNVGIFEMTWGVLCPKCGMLVTTPGGLRALGPNPHCSLCRLDFPAALDDQVEVTFTLESGIRPLRYNDPTRVDPRRDLFKIFFSPSFELTDKQRSMMDAIHGVITLAPGAVGTLQFEAEAGLWALICPTVHAVSFLNVFEGGAGDFEVEVLDGQCIPPNGDITVGRDEVRITNRTLYPIMMCAFQFGEHPPEEHTYTEFKMRPFLTGKRVLTSQTFRELFRTQTVGEHGLRIKNLTVLFTDLEGSTPLYERVGDLRAFELVQEHFSRLEAVVARHRGAIVKTIGDAVMAAFADPANALAAAAGMSRTVQRIDADGVPLRLNVGLHTGSCMAVQTNQQLDYFGGAVNIASRVEGQAEGGEIIATDAVWQTPGVPGLAEDFGLIDHPDVLELKGVVEPTVVHRLSAGI